jgi:hypothetical protein
MFLECQSYLFLTTETISEQYEMVCVMAFWNDMENKEFRKQENHIIQDRS